MKRPAFTVGLTVLVAFLIAGAAGAPSAALAGVLLLALSAAALLIRPVRRRTGPVTVLWTAALAFCLFAAYHVFWVDRQLEQAGRTVALSGQITGYPDGTDGQTGVLTVRTGDLPAGTRVLIHAGGLTPYAQVQGTFALTALDTGSAAGLSARSDGIFLRAYPRSMRSMPAQDEPWYAAVHAFGQRMADAVCERLPGEEGALIAAVCLGRKARLSADTTEAFRRAGLAHVLALSGLHLSVLTGALLRILKKLRLPRAVQAAVTVAGIWIFVLAADAGASLLRAAVMLTLAVAAPLLFRQADGLNSLGAALLLLLLMQPCAAYDAGLLLSFAATLGILTVYPPLKGWFDARLFSAPPPEKRIRRLGRAAAQWAVAGVCLSVSAVWLTNPVTAMFFGTVSVFTPLVNLVTLLPAAGTITLGLAAAAGLCVPGLRYGAPVLLLPAGLLARFCIWAARTAAGWPLQFEVSVPVGLLLTGVTAAGTLVWLYTAKRRREARTNDPAAASAGDPER